MQIVRDLAGYSLGRSDLMRRAMAKKKKDVMAKEREYFVDGMVDENGHVVIDGCVRRGVPRQVAEHIYDEMSSFASYAFNKSHAAAYGLVAVQTAWLKLHHPVPFMAAILNSVMDNPAQGGRLHPVLPRPRHSDPAAGREPERLEIQRGPGQSGRARHPFRSGRREKRGTGRSGADRERAQSRPLYRHF